MSGTKQIRLGKVQRFYVKVLAQTLNVKIELDASTIPEKKDYYQGKYDALEEVIKGMGKEFSFNREGISHGAKVQTMPGLRENN